MDEEVESSLMGRQEQKRRFRGVRRRPWGEVRRRDKGLDSAWGESVAGDIRHAGGDGSNIRSGSLQLEVVHSLSSGHSSLEGTVEASESTSIHGIKYQTYYLLNLLLELDGRTQTRLLITHVEMNQLIGNPLLDRDIPATYEYYWSHGMISDEIGLKVIHECDFEDYTFSHTHNVSKTCNDAFTEPEKIVGDYVNPYDVILDVCYPSIMEQELRLKNYITRMSVGVDVCMTSERRYYFNLPEVQQALRANRTSLPYSWSMCSDEGRHVFTLNGRLRLDQAYKEKNIS